MEKIIFFGLVIPILAFVLYLGGTAIMKGFEAKKENKSKEDIENQDIEQNLSENNDKLTDELNKLNQLLKDGDLIFHTNGSPLMKIDYCSNLVFQNKHDTNAPLCLFFCLVTIAYASLLHLYTHK